MHNQCSSVGSTINRDYNIEHKSSRSVRYTLTAQIKNVQYNNYRKKRYFTKINIVIVSKCDTFVQSRTNSIWEIP